MSAAKTIGFIGLGVMGEPICRNLLKKSGAPVVAFDLAGEPLQRLRAEGARIATCVAEVAQQGEILFLCLPNAKQVRAVFEGDGILSHVRKGQIVIDLGTTSVRPAISPKNCGQKRRPGSMLRSRAHGRRHRMARSASWLAGRLNSMAPLSR